MDKLQAINARSHKKAAEQLLVQPLPRSLLQGNLSFLQSKLLKLSILISPNAPKGVVVGLGWVGNTAIV
jgi:hypothetical protein